MLAVLARVLTPRLSEFSTQELANTAWAFATVEKRTVALFAALAMVAGPRLGEFNAQALANTA